VIANLKERVLTQDQYSDQQTSPSTIMSQSRCQGNKRGYTSSNSIVINVKKTSPYSGEFAQKMIDLGVYPNGYRLTKETPTLKPRNLAEIRAKLCQRRPSLSPSAFSQTAFEDFQANQESEVTEKRVIGQVVPIIAGPKDKDSECTGDVLFNHLEKFDPFITAPKPDAYYGARPDQIDAIVRRDLGQYITPSRSTNLPAAPNFFRQDKSAYGRADVAGRQAMYDGAVGARAMFHLQNYGNVKPGYDGNAYTLSSTYHADTGTLQIYATHPSRPADGDAWEPKYHTTQVNAFALAGDIDGFRGGASLYRNAREWTQQQRDRLIAHANEVARARLTTTTVCDRTDGHKDPVPVAGEWLGTSVEQVDIEREATVKRQRRR
jgi:hypothetical protein